MTVHELQQEILRLKREKNICILAHAYQSQPVLEVADYTGDSYGLSVQARTCGNRAEGQHLLDETLRRDGFWPCYAWLAAWSERNQRHLNRL